jgi:glycosyltransferase involved in cell wall biosynthesis
MNSAEIEYKLSKNKLLSVVVPVYNNCETVRETCLRVLQLKEDRLLAISVELVFVDDGSTDESWPELQRLAHEFSQNVSLVKLSRNFGQVNAILAGYQACSGDAVVTISADLQDPIGIIAEMVAHWEQGTEIVIAHRESRADDISATLFSKIAYGVARKANPRIPAGGFDYLLLSRRAADLMLSFQGHHRFFQGDVLWLGLPTAFIPYAREKRPQGKSAWSFSRKFKYFTDLVLDSSYLPIRIMSALGVIVATIGLIYAFVIVLAWFRGETPFAGWAPIMITLLVVSGLIMTMLGIIGEYIWRIYDEVKGKPTYIIERKLTIKKND